MTKRTGITTKALTMGSSALYHLILSQAGTLGKAITELVSNSIDAGASQVDITLTDTHYTVTDDGCGFQSESDVDTYFAPLAFDHTTPEEAGKRQFGRFGIGRGQQWAFASTVYRSRRLSMDVNPKVRGFEFDLRHHRSEFPGTRITGTLYERLSLNAKSGTEKELREAVQYLAVPVTLNGKRISHDPATERWDHEDDVAWYRFSDGHTMQVYNMGIHVRTYSSYHTGVGGVIVSKPGKPFELNMARNDVLTSRCATWRHVEQVARRQARRNTTRTRLSENDYHTLIRELLENADQVIPERLFNLKVFADHRGRSMTAPELLSQVHAHGGRVIAFSEERRRTLERLQTNKQLLALHPRTFTRLGTPSDGRTPIQHLQHVVTAVLARIATDPRYSSIVVWATQKTVTYLEDLPQDLAQHADRYETYATPPGDVIHTLRAVNHCLPHLIQQVKAFLTEQGQTPGHLHHTARCGQSDAASFWVNTGTLVIERGILEDGQRHAEGWNRMLMYLARAVLNLLLDTTRELADENTELEHRLMYSSHYTLLQWNLRSLTHLTGMAGRNEVILSAQMRRTLSDLFALDATTQNIATDQDRQSLPVQS